MSDNLKFRAWDLKLKKFSFFDLSCCLPIYGNSEEFCVDQWTGVCDKNKNPIFENDILKDYNHKQYQVSWYDNAWDFKVSPYSFYYNDQREGDTFDDAGGMKIIGNIYQNKELLK